MTNKDNFEERLLTELRQVAADQPEPAERRTAWRPTALALGGGGLAVAVAAVAIIAGSGGNTTSAYAVEKDPDGAVTVKIKSLKDAGGLETKLRDAGIPAVVDYAPAMTIDCQSSPERLGKLKSAPSNTSVEAEPGTSVKATKVDGEGVPADASSVAMKASPVSEETTFTIDPGTIKEGEKLYLTTATRADATTVSASVGPRAQNPDC